MPEATIPDVNPTPAESSPAEHQTFEVPRGGQEYANWRMTGKLPEKPKKAESAPAKESSAAEQVEKDAPVSETGKESQDKPKVQPKRDTAETRLQELLADLRTAGLSPSELKTFKREASKPVEQAKPPEQTVKPPEPKAEIKKPKLEDFKTWEEYDNARDEYYTNVAAQKAAEAVAKDRQERAAEEQRKTFTQRMAEARERYGSEAEGQIVKTAQAIHGDQAVPVAIRSMLDSSPVLVDLMYVMGSKPDDLAAFIAEAKSDPAAAIRRMVVTEHFVKEELAGRSKAAPADIPERGEDGKFVSSKPPAKKVTQAPEPATEVSGRAAPPPDAMEQAIAGKDFASYRKEANARDLRRLKGL